MNRPLVLVVDDDPDILDAICDILDAEGYRVARARHGAEALERVAVELPSVILLDLMMPRVDGFGVIEYLRAHPQATKPVVLVITAYADQKFKRVDPNIVAGVVRKPFEVAELGSLVRLCAQAMGDVVNRPGRGSEQRDSVGVN